jgi:hypothetical protein
MIDSSTALKGRYRLSTALKAAGPVIRWIAVDGDTGNQVVLSVVEPMRIARLEAAKGKSHLHLAGIRDLVKNPPAEVVPAKSIPEGTKLPPGFAIAVAEYVPGTTLHQLLTKGALQPAKIVAWTLRLVEAIRTLHASGSVHGAISPRSVIAEPMTRAIAPVLSELLTPTVGAFCSPERLKGASPNPTDDVWALFATLYAGITGQAPYASGERDALLQAIAAGTPRSVADFGVVEPVLDAILMRGLASEKSERIVDLEELTKYLDAWERMEPQVPPRPPKASQFAARSLAGIVSGGASGGTKGVVFDETTLPGDEELIGPAHVRRPPARPAAPPPPSAEAVLGPLNGQAAAAAAETPLPIQARVSAPEIVAGPKRPSVNPFAKKSSPWPILLGILAVLGGGGAFLAFALQEDPKPVAVKPPAPVTTTAAPTASVRKKPRLTPEQRVNECVAAYFPEQAFEDPEAFGFICETPDLRESSAKLYELSEAKNDKAALLAEENAKAEFQRLLDERQKALEASKRGEAVVIPPRPKGPVPQTAAERNRRPLGWYELASTAVIRRGCCPQAAPIRLPETPGWCEQLQEVLREFADESEKVGDLAPKAKRFDKAVSCLFGNGIQRPYEYKKAPEEPNRQAFQQFLSHAAVVDATRRSER